MHLLLIRHAAAESRERFAERSDDDDLRPLTERGRRRMTRGATGLRRLVPELDLLAASPLVRAQQTAGIVARAYGHLPIATTAALEPHRAPSALLAWLRAQEQPQVVAVVGHEPQLGVLVTWLLTGLEASRVRFGKGGACLLELGPGLEEGEATLHWALTGRQLRTLGG